MHQKERSILILILCLAFNINHFDLYRLFCCYSYLPCLVCDLSIFTLIWQNGGYYGFTFIKNITRIYGLHNLQSDM